jgi:hypothetical protein
MCTQGLNFDTKRPRRDILQDYRDVLEKIYDPVAYAGRVKRLTALLNNASRARQIKGSVSGRTAGNIELMQRLFAGLPEPKRIFREAVSNCAATNPKSVRYILGKLAFYMHLGPFSRYVMGRLDEMIADLDETELAAHAMSRDAPRGVLMN